MKTFLPLLALTLLLGVTTQAQDIDKLPSITVSGTSEVQVAPDEVTFSIDVTKVDKDLQIAKRQNDEVVANILALAKRFAVDPQNVKTDNISVNMKYVITKDPKNKIYDEDGDEIGKKVFRGYEVSTTVHIKLTDLARFSDFFTETMKTGLTELNSVTFSTSKLREIKDQARDMAMKATREKATAMAGSIGQTIGKAVHISEENSSNQNSNYNGSANNTTTFTRAVSEPLATFAPGAIKVEAQVTVTYLLN